MMPQFQRNVKPFVFAQVSGPLLSQPRLFRLEPLSHEQTLDLLKRALDDPDATVLAGEGGGYGWLRNKYGLSCDNLIAARKARP